MNKDIEIEKGILKKKRGWIRDNIALVSIIAIAACLRIYKIDYQSLWVDEIHTLNETNPEFSFSEMYSALLRAEPHPQLYFVLVHFAFKIFGYSSLVLRLFSAVVGVAGVISMYFLGREIFNRKTGLYAAILIAFNYFHLFYSQEARMYALFFLCTTLSFYFFIRFLKRPTTKSCLIYTFFALTMAYSHFFGLFSLASQYLILLFFIIKPITSTGLRLFYLSLMSGIITFICYLPNYYIIERSAGVTSSWIPKPTGDVFTELFRDFFGQSEVVTTIAVILVIKYFNELFRQRDPANYNADPDRNKMVFGFVILILWISVTLLLPLIRSYISVPLMINRYFINVVPAIVIILAIGLYHIKSDVARFCILGVVIVYSLTDIFIVKEYYSKMNKTQFRDISEYVIKNNSNGDPLVSNLAWYFPFYFRNDSTKIVDDGLESYVFKIAKDSSNISPFWFADGHNRAHNTSQTALKFLERHFVVDKHIALHACWVRHYKPITDSIYEFSASEYEFLKNGNNTTFTYYVDYLDTIWANKINIGGFAFFGDRDATHSIIGTFLLKDNKAYKIQTTSVRREDIAPYFKNSHDLNNSGYSAKLDITSLAPGKYQLGVILEDTLANKKGVVVTDKFYVKR